MQTLGIKRTSTADTEQARPGPGRDLAALFAGAAVTIGAVGAVLALTDSGSPLRGAFALFFLFSAPASAIAAVLRGLDPYGRVLASVAGAVVVDMLVAQGMLAVHRWSINGGIIAVAVISGLIALSVLMQRMHSRTTADKVV
ncbi:hypothetical protein AB0I51_07705 [Streptomyces sp. NPDC050549]|uniref:hypothetical protein n=1 Tax=Streptomyces sp. NPDC050549 TaxID=3155406 RepID=UPI00343E8433